MSDPMESVFRDYRSAPNNSTRDEIARLRAALAGVLQHCVTVRGMPDKGKGRTDAQQAALDAARAALKVSP